MPKLCRTLGLMVCLWGGNGPLAWTNEPSRPANPPASQPSGYPARQATYEAPLADPRRDVVPPQVGVAPYSLPSQGTSVDSRMPGAHATAPGNAPPGPIPLAALAARKESSLPLQPAGQNGGAFKSTGTGALATALGSLAVVVALFLTIAWLMRRGLPASATLLPSEVVEILGRAPLAGRQQMQLIRCGNKLLLVCLSVGGAETLTEITDAAEVDRLAGLCREAHPQSATAAFRHVFHQFGRERTARGFLGATADNHAPSSVAGVARRLPMQEDDDV